MSSLTEYFNNQQTAMLDLLQQLVEIESPTHDKAAVNRMADRVAAEMGACGGSVRRIPGQDTGDIVIAEWNQEASKSPFLIMCHMDTVYPLGTLAERPPRVEGELFYGPGSLDMKAGIVIALTALSGLAALGISPSRPVTLLCTADEEVGSAASLSTIETLAAQSGLVLCLEAALPGSVIKTARKGVGRFNLKVTGRSSHAGANHQEGINAILQMAQHILTLQNLTDYEKGTTVNVGTIKGGTTSNVVPDHCEIEVDFRVATPEEGERLLTTVANLQPHHPDARITSAGELNRPPMVRDETMIRTFNKAAEIAARHGITLQEGSTGGGSDGNFTAALGIPTLDGLGADGSGGHAAHENIRIASLTERASLLAAVLSEW